MYVIKITDEDNNSFYHNVGQVLVSDFKEATTYHALKLANVVQNRIYNEFNTTRWRTRISMHFPQLSSNFIIEVKELVESRHCVSRLSIEIIDGKSSVV